MISQALTSGGKAWIDNLSVSFQSSLSYPGNLTKSNSEDLWSSLVSTPELCSDKSLCQESDIPLIH